MSKAFTRESDDFFDDQPATFRPNLPGASRNYITAGGAQRLREELRGLVEEARPLLLKRTDSAKEVDLRRLDARIQRLQGSLNSSVVVEATGVDASVIRFGASVEVATLEGATEIYRIVGVDEVDMAPDSVSWLSPVAKALTGKKVGDVVRLELPGGVRELTVRRIWYA